MSEEVLKVERIVRSVEIVCNVGRNVQCAALGFAGI
jgi:hypothetical protein